MLKKNIEKYVGLLLTFRIEDCMLEILGDSVSSKIDHTIDYRLFQEKIDEYIKRHNNRTDEQQLESILNEIGETIYNRIREQDLYVLDEVERFLEQEFEILEIDFAIRRMLKEDLMCQFLLYTKNRDVLFFNQLIERKENQQRHNAMERRLLELEKTLSAYTECKFQPLKKSSKYFHIDNLDKMEMRTREMEEIKKRIEGNSNVLFLYGRPGIGKTTLVKLYAREHISRGGRVFFEKYEKSIEYTVGKLAKNQNKNASKEVIDYWRNQKGVEREKTLLIIDNFNEDCLQGDNKGHFNKELKGDFYKELIDLGIKILFTTRINVENNVYIVQPVADPIALFVRYSEMTESDAKQSELLIKDVIEIVKANTLLIILIARIWKRIDEDEKDDLVNKLRANRLIECRETVVVSADIDAIEDMTIYEQVSALLDFSGIMNDVAAHKIFANAVLLPIEGMNRFMFKKLTNCQDDNGLYRLIRSSWILCDYNDVYVHPVVKEIAFRRNLVTYEVCNDYCKNINAALRIELSFEERFPYMKCAEEIYSRFKNLDKLDDVLVNLFYRLSAMYDILADPQRSMEVINTIRNDIEEVMEGTVDKARMLSGIAYSLSNYFDSMETLEQAKKLLDDAKKLIGEESDNCELAYVQAYGRILSNYGLNCLAKSKCNLNRKKEYLENAINWHQKALEYRQRKHSCFKDEATRRIIDSEIAVSYTTVATDYFYLEEYGRAIEYHLYAYEIREKMHLEREKNINSQRIIGCIIAQYKKSAMIEQKYIQLALSYFPQLLQTSFAFGMLNVVKENLNYFIQLTDIVKNDMVFKSFSEEIVEKTKGIVVWLNDNESLRKLFHIEIEMLSNIFH